MAPTWARASTMRTPGSVGRPGKWPAKNASSPVSRQRPVADCPGSTATSSSTNRNGGRCGRTSAGAGRSPARQPCSDFSRLAGVSFGLTLGHASSILPFSSTRNAERMMPMVLLAVHRLLAPRPVGVGDRVVLVGEQREAEAVLLVELGLLGRLVGADAEHGGVADVAEDVPHPAGLRRAAGRVGLRVEEHEHLATLERREVDVVARLVGQLDRGGLVTW